MDKFEKDLKRIFDYYVETDEYKDLYPAVINCDTEAMNLRGNLPYQMTKTVLIDDLKYKNGKKTMTVDLDMCKDAINNRMFPWNCFFVASREEDKRTKYKAYIPLKKETFYKALEEFTPLLVNAPYCVQNKYRVYPSNDTLVFRFYDIKGALYLNDYINKNSHLKEYIGENLYLKKLDNVYIMEEKQSSSYMSFVSDIIREYFDKFIIDRNDITKENFINFVNKCASSNNNSCNGEFKDYLLDVLNGNYEFKYTETKTDDDKVVNGNDYIEEKQKKSLSQVFSAFVSQFKQDSNLNKFIYSILSISKYLIDQKELNNLEIRSLNAMAEYIASDLEDEILNNDNIEYYLKDNCFYICDRKNVIFKINFDMINTVNSFDELNKSTTKELGTIGYASYKNKKCIFNCPCTRSFIVDRYNNGLSSMFILTEGDNEKKYTVDDIGLDGSVINKKVDLENKKEVEYIKYSNTSGRVNVYRLSKGLRRINKRLIMSNKKGEPDDVKIYSIKRKKII